MKRFVHPILILYIGLAGILFLATACEDNLEFSRKVTFTAAGGYQNGPQTKTAYSDAEFKEGTKIYERIDWVVNDLIRITSDKAQTPAGKAFADYKVTNVSGTSSRISNAEIETVGNNGLNWGTGTNTFYALYPAPSTDGAQSGVDITTTNTGATFTGVIPRNQTVTLRDTIYQPDMCCAYMWAAKSASQGGDVELAFRPAITTLAFTIGNPESGTMRVSHLRVLTPVSSGKALTGSFTGTINKSSLECTYECQPINDNNRYIDIDFRPVLEIPSGEFKTVTALGLPQDLTSLTVRITLEGGETRELALNNSSGTPYVFSATKKYHIALGVPTSYVYTFNVNWNMSSIPYTEYSGTNNDYNVTSYRTLNGSATKKAVGWHAEFSSRYRNNTNGSQWSQWTAWSTTPPDWLYSFTSSATAAEAGTGTKKYRAKANAVTGHNTHSDVLRAKNPEGSQNSPYDLSTHTITGGNVNQTTANCYIVSAPGWYMFPLVYGNAMKNGRDNTDAYNPSSLTAGTGVLKPFKKHNNSNITEPDISGTSSAELVWQDARNLVSNISVYNTNYIRFYVSHETISQGNAVIAAKNSSGTVLWSWHIWVTDQTFSDVSLWGSNFMPVNLGWCDGGSMTYESREVQVRFIQDGSGTVKGPFTLSQNIGNPPHSATLLGNCTYYQWGRKDPMIPAKGTTDNVNDNKTYYTASGQSRNDISVRLVQRDGSPTIGWCIQNPDFLILSNTTAYADWMDSHYNNLWNSKSAVASSSTFISTKGKTVYDPCPPGYIVPPTGASTLTEFDRIEIGGYSTNNNWFTYSNMRWPVVGCRLLLTDGSLVGGNEVNDGGQKVTGYGNYAGGYGKLMLSTAATDSHTNLLLWGPPDATVTLAPGGDFKKKLGRYHGNGKASATPVRCIKE